MPSRYLALAGKSVTIHYIQVVEATTANGVCTLRIKAVALPGAVATALDENADLIRMMLAATSAQSSTEPPAVDLPEHSHLAENSTAAADDADLVRGRANQQQQQQQQHSSVDGAAVQESEEPTDGTASDTWDTANGQTSSSAGPDVRHGTGISAARTAQGLNDTERVGGSRLGLADPPQGSQADPSDPQHGAQGPPRITGGFSSNTNGTKGAEKAACISNSNDAEQQSEEEGQSTASGKVGVLKQRLLAAAKEAKSDSSALLKVSLTSLCFNNM